VILTRLWQPGTAFWADLLLTVEQRDGCLGDLELGDGLMSLSELVGPKLSTSSARLASSW